MLGRRDFLQSSVALPAALMGWPGAANEFLAGGAYAVTPDLAIADRYLDGGSSFAARARAAGLQAYVFASDVAGLWIRELEPRLRVGSVSIAGYTSTATLFCLDVLARDYGARIVERREHGPGVTWVLSSTPVRRGALAPLSPSTRG